MSPRKGSLPPRDTDCRARPIRFHCSAGRGVRKSANQTWRGWSRRVEALCVLSLYDLITSEQPAAPAGTESSSLSTSDAVLDQQQILDYVSWLLFALFFFCFFLTMWMVCFLKLWYESTGCCRIHKKVNVEVISKHIYSPFLFIVKYLKFR